MRGYQIPLSRQLTLIRVLQLYSLLKLLRVRSDLVLPKYYFPLYSSLGTTSQQWTLTCNSEKKTNPFSPELLFIKVFFFNHRNETRTGRIKCLHAHPKSGVPRADLKELQVAENTRVSRNPDGREDWILIKEA